MKRLTYMLLMLLLFVYPAAAQVDGFIASGSVTSAAAIITQDVRGYNSVAVQVTSAGSGTITYEASNDGVTYFVVACYTPLNLGTTTPVTTSTTTILLVCPTTGRFFQVRVSTYTSGTIAATAVFRNESLAKLGVFIANASLAVVATGVAGTSAHDAAISGNPVRVGCRALTANYAAVQTGDAADCISTLVGAQIYRQFSIPEADWSFVAPAGGKTATGGVTMQTAGAAGIRNYVTGCQVSNSGAAGTEVQLKDGAAGTVIWRHWIGATSVGIPVTFPSPIKTTAATLLEYDLSSGVTVAVFANCQGYQAP